MSQSSSSEYSYELSVSSRTCPLIDMAATTAERTCAIDEHVHDDRVNKRLRDIQVMKASVRESICSETRPPTPDPYGHSSKRERETIKTKWKQAAHSTNILLRMQIPSPPIRRPTPPPPDSSPPKRS